MCTSAGRVLSPGTAGCQIHTDMRWHPRKKGGLEAPPKPAGQARVAAGGRQNLRNGETPLENKSGNRSYSQGWAHPTDKKGDEPKFDSLLLLFL